MKKIFLICLLLISFLGAAQEEFTKKYTHAQAVEFGAKTEIKEETTYVDLLTPDTENLSIRILCETENGTQIIVEIPTGGNVLRFVFAENYYITLFNF